MKLARLVLSIVCALAILGFLGSFALEASFLSRSRTVLIVQPDPSGLAKGGEGYRVLGQTERVVLDDPKAYLPGLGEGKVWLVDQRYLLSKGIHPLQVSTVGGLAWFARAGCLVAIVATLVGLRSIRS